MSSDPFSWIDESAAERERAGLSRRLESLGPGDRPGRVARDGRSLVNFASNDYLGLAGDPRVVAAAREAAGRFGWGAGASPLVCGWTEAHRDLAEAIAEFEHAESVALFPTGFAANLGAIAALVGPGDAVYSDRLNHASLIQGARLSGASLRVYPHGDADRLASLLGRDRGRFRRSLIATDGVFSMDGDLAPLPELAELADRFGAMLLVDEAHGTGVFGPDGRGAASALGVADRVPVRVGTLSKAIGSVGGFVAGARRLVEHLVNHAPTLVYSTAMPPACAAAAGEAIRLSRDEPWRRERSFALGRAVRDAARAAGLVVPPSDGPIVPVILGEADRAVAASESLRAAGLLVPAIRPPTVPRGQSRLRISLSAALADEDVDRLLRAMDGLARGGA